MRMKNWFRGAKDANPDDIERQEVDLAQAIIDLHKIDPQTGEILLLSVLPALSLPWSEKVQALTGTPDAGGGSASR